VVSQFTGSLAKQLRAIDVGDRRRGIAAGPRAFERIADRHRRSFYVAGLARSAVQIFELVEVGLQFVVGYVVVLDRHIIRQEPGAVPVDVPAAEFQILG
jgi:hypothetical protein